MAVFLLLLLAPAAAAQFSTTFTDRSFVGGLGDLTDVIVSGDRIILVDQDFQYTVYSNTDQTYLHQTILVNLTIDLDGRFNTGVAYREPASIVDPDLPTVDNVVMLGVDIVLIINYDRIASGSPSEILVVDAEVYYPNGTLAWAGDVSSLGAVTVYGSGGDLVIEVDWNVVAQIYQDHTGITPTLDPILYFAPFGDVSYSDVRSFITYYETFTVTTAFTVPTNSPTADGDPGDWAGVPPLVVDAGDDIGVSVPYPNVSSIYLAANATHISFMINHTNPMIGMSLLWSSPKERAFYLILIQLDTNNDNTIDAYINLYPDRATIINLDTSTSVTLNPGPDYTLTTNSTGIFEAIIAKAPLPITINPGDTITGTIHFYYTLNDEPGPGPHTALYNGRDLNYTGLELQFPAGYSDPQISDALVTMRLTGPTTGIIAVYHDIVPEPTGDPRTATTVYFTIADPTLILWPVNVTWLAPPGVDTATAIVETWTKTGGMTPLPEDQIVRNPNNITAIIDEPTYLAGDPLLAFIPYTALVGGDLATSQTTTIAPLLLVAAVAALGAALAARRR